MIGVLNRLPGMPCEVGTCYAVATHTEEVVVIPSNPELEDERHAHQIVLCRQHDEQFHRNGLIGIVTMYGDQICDPSHFTHDWRHFFDQRKAACRCRVRSVRRFLSSTRGGKSGRRGD